MMKYKGYIAAVAFDQSAEILHGRVINSGPYPIATFEAPDAGDLRGEFQRSIDEYLAWCDDDGVQPRNRFRPSCDVRAQADWRSSLRSLLCIL